jgi:Bacterial SH3 domain
MTAVATYDENFTPGSFSGLTTHPGFGMPVSYKFKRDTGFFSGGLLSGIITILLLLYLGGGPNALQPITFVVNKKAKDKYQEDRRILEEIRRNPENLPPQTGAIIYGVRSPNVNMRICPGLDCDVIYTLQPGMQIADAGAREYSDYIDWIRVSVNGREGWVSRRLLLLPGDPPPTIVNPVGPDSLRVRISDIWLRECPGLTCREIEPLPLGALVANLGQSRPVDAEWWIRIRYGSREGWVIRNTLE